MGYKLRPIPESNLTRVAEGMVMASLPFVLVAIPLTRAGQIEAETGLLMMIVGYVTAILAVAVVFVAGVEIWMRGYTGLSRFFRVLFVAVLVLAYPGYLMVQAVRLPPINDVTTDLEHPPEFSNSAAAVAGRGGKTPPASSPRSRALQARAYPAIKTLTMETDAEAAFALVRDAVTSSGLKIIDAAVPGVRGGIGRIEAVAESRLLRFKDDVVIRIQQKGNESRIDIRSVGRVGKHDFGENAKRIERLFEEIAASKE